MAHEEDDETKWHLDKRVPLALIILILVQTGSAIWWAAAVSGSISAIEKRVDFLDEVNRRQYDLMSADRSANLQTAKQLARLEGLLQSIDRQVAAVVAHILKGATR